MKKQKLSLSKKLFLNKETVASLNNNEQEHILGGASKSCGNTQTQCGSTCAQRSCLWGPPCGPTDPIQCGGTN